MICTPWTTPSLTWTSTWYVAAMKYYFEWKIFVMIYHQFYQGLKLTFPVDNTLQECFEKRESCVNNDWDAEVTEGCLQQLLIWFKYHNFDLLETPLHTHGPYAVLGWSSVCKNFWGLQLYVTMDWYWRKTRVPQPDGRGRGGCWSWFLRSGFVKLNPGISLGWNNQNHS